MDKKSKKRLEVLRQRLAKLHERLKAERSQPDDVSEIERLENEISQTEVEIERIKASG